MTAMLSYSGWLVIDRHSIVAFKKREPALNAGERAIWITLKVPATLFQRPELRADITIPTDDQPDALIAKVIGSVQEHVREATGIEVVLQRVREEPPSDS